MNVKMKLLLAAAVVCMFYIPGTVPAADYPTKPVEIIVPFGAGGGSDITARLMVNKFSTVLGGTVVIVNKAGGGGTIGTYAALAAPPDGYTISLISPTMIFAPLVTKSITYNYKSFLPINISVTSPYVMVVRKEAPWQTLEEVVAEAKRTPGKLTFSSAGYGGSDHFVGELFKMDTGVNITHVPLDGSGPAIVGVLGGHISMAFANLGVANKYLKAGSLRLLTVHSKKRLSAFPDVPTVIEKGLPNLVFDTWQGFAVRHETSGEIVGKLGNALRDVFNDKEIIEKFEKAGWIVENLGLKEATEYLSIENQKRVQVAKAANIVPK